MVGFEPCLGFLGFLAGLATGSGVGSAPVIAVAAASSSGEEVGGSSGGGVATVVDFLVGFAAAFFGVEVEAPADVAVVVGDADVGPVVVGAEVAAPASVVAFDAVVVVVDTDVGLVDPPVFVPVVATVVVGVEGAAPAPVVALAAVAALVVAVDGVPVVAVVVVALDPVVAGVALPGAVVALEATVVVTPAGVAAAVGLDGDDAAELFTGAAEAASLAARPARSIHTPVAASARSMASTTRATPQRVPAFRGGIEIEGCGNEASGKERCGAATGGALARRWTVPGCTRSDSGACPRGTVVTWLFCGGTLAGLFVGGMLAGWPFAARGGYDAFCGGMLLFCGGYDAFCGGMLVFCGG